MLIARLNFAPSCVKFKQYLFMFGRGLFIIAQGFHKEGVKTIKQFVVAWTFFEVSKLSFEVKFKLILLQGFMWVLEG